MKYPNIHNISQFYLINKKNNCQLLQERGQYAAYESKITNGIKLIY